MIFDFLVPKTAARGATSSNDLALAIINEIREGVVVANEKGIITLFNPAAATLTGWKVEDATSLDARSIFKLYDKTEHPLADELNPILVALHSAKIATNDDCYIETASGNHLLISLTATPILADIAPTRKKSEEIPAGPKLSSLAITFRDITNERADQNQQTEFISTASHEMRTPDEIMEGNIGMILNPATGTMDTRARTYAEKAHEAAQHLGRLFQDLLDVTKADDHRTLTNKVLVNAVDAAREIVADFQDIAHKKGLTLKYRETAKPADSKVISPIYVIYVDYDQLKEILGNLVENALKYTKSGGVEVGVEDDGGRARFEIRDTGLGIPPEDIPHLFQKFYRVDSSDTRTIGGTGLGLYLIKKLTENLGGRVGVESELGRGSIFWVEFDILSREEIMQRAHEIRARAEKR